MDSNILSLRNIILGVGIFATLASVIVFSHPSKKTESGAQGNVTIWGTVPQEIISDSLQRFNPTAKNYGLTYIYIPEEKFNQKLLEGLANNNGPDLILAPYQMILTQAQRLQPFPITATEYKNIYVDGAGVLYAKDGALALPVSIEPMVLFYNRSFLSKHSIVKPPETWDELSDITSTLTLQKGNKIVESAIPLGTPDTPYAKDIIMAIVSQLGQVPVLLETGRDGKVVYTVTANTPVTEDSQVFPLATTMRFFTQFSDSGQSSYTWNTSLGDPITAFIAEKVAMYIGYAGEYEELKARNPRADFGMTYFPQTKGYNTFKTGMRMYAIASLKASKNPTTAFVVESQLAGADFAPGIASTLGGVAPLRSVLNSSNLDPVLMRSALVAYGWYDSHPTETSMRTTSMISDIINYRYGPNEASNMFVARLRDIYTNQ